MSTVAVVKELKRLSYTDMKELALCVTSELHKACPVGRHLTTVEVADALSQLPDTATDMAAATNKHLVKAFSSRQKTIRVTPSTNGWTVEFGKHQAVGTNLPDALNSLLDQIAVMKAMGVS